MVAAEPRPAWRCEGCGRVSQALVKPPYHWRHGAHCGPFAPAVVAPDGAVLAPAGSVIAAPTVAVSHGESDPALRYRQSTLRSYIACPRATVLASHHTTGTIGSSGDLGSAFHAVAAEIRRTLRRHGETQMATQEAIEVMREVVAAGPWVLTAADYLGSGDQIGLVGMVCNFTAEPWNPARFMAIEQRLSMEIACPDGEIRTFTGTPDLVIADPGQPPGVIIVDDKTGMGKPAMPREPTPEGEPIRGVQYMADPQASFFQLVGYGALAMHEWPRIQRATLREKNWRWGGPPREATMTREDLEHVLPYLGELMMKLDQGLREGEGSEFAQPRPGRHCNTRCPVKRSCGVPQEQRGLGVLDSHEAADAEARRWAVVRALSDEMRAALKSYHEEAQYAPQVNDDLVVRWRDRPSGKGREFGLFPPAPAPDPKAQAEADAAFVAAMEEELARRTGMAA